MRLNAMSQDSNRVTKTPALNPRKTPKDDSRENCSVAHCGYERLDGGKRKSDSPFSSTDRQGLSDPVYLQDRVYDDY
jgi:hypothetical protein